MQGPFLRKYGVETTVDFQLFETDGASFKTDAAHAAGDSVVMKDEGAEANTANAFVDEGRGYSITLTATEMQAARIVVYVVDQTSPAVWIDAAIVVETYGNASAMHAFDLDTATQDVNTTTIEGGDATDAINAACDAAIETYNLDHLLAVACPGNVITGAVVDHSALACLAAVGNDISDYDATTDSLEAIGTDLDQSLSTMESDIRGADADTLKTLSDQLDAITADAIWDEEMDANAPAACNTAREYMNVMIAADAGKSAGTGDWSARDLGDTKTRIQGTLSAAGARSSVDTLDGT